MTVADLIAAIRAADRADLPRLMLEIASRLVEVPASTAPATQEPDALLDVAETATRLGKSKSWVYHNHKDLPFVVNGIGAGPRFSKRGLEKYIANRQA